MMGRGEGGGKEAAFWLGKYMYVSYATYAMKRKLTITVEREMIPRARRLPRQRGVSLDAGGRAGERRASSPTPAS